MNIIADKSYAFAIKIVHAYKSLADKKEFVLSRQLLRSGTAVKSTKNSLENN